MPNYRLLPALPAPAYPAGTIAPGNIDINNRPIVPNPQAGPGQSSTVWSTSFGNDKGEVLVPRITDGEDGLPPHILGDRSPRRGVPSEAEAYYNKYGKSLGTFPDYHMADAYGEALHEQQAQLQPYGAGIYGGMRTSLPQRIQALPEPSTPVATQIAFPQSSRMATLGAPTLPPIKLSSIYGGS